MVWPFISLTKRFNGLPSTKYDNYASHINATSDNNASTTNSHFGPSSDKSSSCLTTNMSNYSSFTNCTSCTGLRHLIWWIEGCHGCTSYINCSSFANKEKSIEEMKRLLPLAGEVYFESLLEMNKRPTFTKVDGEGKSSGLHYNFWNRVWIDFNK